MASYRILIKRSAQKEIKSVGTKKDRRKIIERIRKLAKNPRPPGCRKLSGSEFYRIRQGRYRVVYQIEDDALVICVVKVGHRKDVYG